MIGNFKLNNVWYKSKTGLPTQTLANQMASKVGQGQSTYGDLTTWSAWIQEDWQDGIGRVKPHLNGGFLYSEAESRVPGQIILPPKVGREGTNVVTGDTYTPDDITGSITVGTGGYEAVAWRWTTPSGLSGSLNFPFWVYLKAPAGTVIRFGVHEISFGVSTEVSSGNLTVEDDIEEFRWYGNSVGHSYSSSTDYYLAVSVTSGGPIELATSTTGGLSQRHKTAGVWSTTGLPNNEFVPFICGQNLFYGTGLAMPSSLRGSGFFFFNDVLYLLAVDTVYKRSSSTWEEVGTIPTYDSMSPNNRNTQPVVFDSTVYFGCENNNYSTMIADETLADGGMDIKLFAKADGRLWRAIDNYVEYSSDASNWEPTASFGAPIYVCDDSDTITGMCGLGDSMYVATQEGLLRVYPGDIVRGVMPWGSIDADNGKNMVSFEGALYITVNGRIWRVTEDGAYQDVWTLSGEGLGGYLMGRVWSMCTTNNWLMALVGGEFDGEWTTVWAMQNNSWHHIATLPQTVTSGGSLNLARDMKIFYNRATSAVYTVNSTGMVCAIYIPDYAANPYYDDNYVYSHNAWMEWDWFDSPILEAPKDYESVIVFGENFSATCYAEVYWKDDDSTDWELLGTATSNAQELRWDIDGGTRPNTTRFKLGIKLVTKDGSETPRIRAIRVKYHLMVRDWFRWSLQIDVSGRAGATQMLADGTVNNLTASQIKSNLDTLAKQVPPFVYQDVDGTMYEVKIIDANFSYTQYEYNENTTDEWWEGVYSIVLEQVTQGTYTP